MEPIKVDKFFKENPGLETWRLLHNTSILANKARQKELRQYGISTSQSAVLDCIKYNKNNATSSQISRWLLRESQSVSMLLNRMEKRGIVTKTQDPNRKNVIRIGMTKKGEEIHKQVIIRESVKGIFDTLSQEEIQQFTSCLEKLQGAARRQLSKLIYQDLISSSETRLR